jgi:DNA-binding NarL/FixJ family response regulator
MKKDHTIAEAWRETFAPRSAAPLGPRLTPKEAATLELLLRAWPDKLVAAELKVTVHAVRRHVTSLLAKFQAHSRAEICLKFLGRL